MRHLKTKTKMENQNNNDNETIDQPPTLVQMQDSTGPGGISSIGALSGVQFLPQDDKTATKETLF